MNNFGPAPFRTIPIPVPFPMDPFPNSMANSMPIKAIPIFPNEPMIPIDMGRSYKGISGFMETPICMNKSNYYENEIDNLKEQLRQKEIENNILRQGLNNSGTIHIGNINISGTQTNENNRDRDFNESRTPKGFFSPKFLDDDDDDEDY